MPTSYAFGDRVRHLVTKSEGTVVWIEEDNPHLLVVKWDDKEYAFDECGSCAHVRAVRKLGADVSDVC